MGAGVFEDEEGAGRHEAAAEHRYGYFGEAGEVVGRIGENEVERSGGVADKAQCVAFHENKVVVVELFGHRTDETCLNG